MSWHVRVATPCDADRIGELVRGALGYDFPPGRIAKRLPVMLSRPTDRIYVVYREEDGLVGGYVHTADYETVYNDGMKNILSLAVDEAFRGQGLGRLLLAEVERWAKACGCEAVRLVSGANRTGAHAFYQRCGYHVRKEQKNFIKYFSLENG